MTVRPSQPRAKCFSCTFQDQDAHVGVIRQLVQSIDQRFTQGAAQRVHDLWAVQGERGNALFGLFQQKDV